MKEKLEFNLTHQMALELIKFNNLKKELIKLKEKEVLNNTELIKISEIENELNKTKMNFIKEFRKSNKEEIDIYLSQKDQKN